MNFVVLWLLFLSTCYATTVTWTNMRSVKGYAELFSCTKLVREQLVFDFISDIPKKGSSYYDALCAYPPNTGSVLLCSAEYANHDMKKMHQIYGVIEMYCSKFTNYKTDVSYFKQQYENATEYFVPLPSVQNATLPIYSPTIPNQKYDRPRFVSILRHYTNMDYSTWYALGLVCMFLAMALVGGIYTLLRATGSFKAINKSKFSKLCQKYIIFPTLLPKGKFTAEYGWRFFTFLAPNRIQYLVDILVFAYHIGVYCAPYYLNDVTFFGTKNFTWRRYLADRSGILAFGEIPLIILFAGRNNFLLYITGWSFSTFMHFHKLMAIWMCIDSIIHSAAFTVNTFYYTEELEYTYFATGIAATVICCVMVGLALHSIRKRFYEYFVVAHILMGVGFITMCWYHCNILGWCEWLVAACAIWFVDRVLRIIRMSAFGVRKATITVVDDELIQVVTTRPPWWTTGAGQYAYIYFGGFLFWQNHPFCVVCKDDKIIAYIKVKNGITKHLWKRVKDCGGPVEWNVCIEGPYGAIGNSGVKKMEETLLFAGGSGAPAMLDVATEITNGKLIWVVPYLSMAKAYSFLYQNIKIPTTIYVTKETGKSRYVDPQELFSSNEEDSSSTEGKHSDTEKDVSLNTNQVEIHYGRPVLAEILDKEITESNASSIGITACGPPRMMDDLRHLVTDAFTKYDKSIDYFDELVVW